MKIPRKDKKRYKKMYINYRFYTDSIKINPKHIRITEKDSMGFVGSVH